MNLWKEINTMVVVILVIVSFKVSAQTPNFILGQWKDANHPEKHMEILSKGGKFVGQSIHSPKPADDGKIILKDLVWVEVSKSYKGILINPDNGDEFKIEIKAIGTNQFRFSAGKLVFSRTFTFNRIAP